MEHVLGLGTTSLRREPMGLATSGRSNWYKRSRNGQSHRGIPTGSVDGEDQHRHGRLADFVKQRYSSWDSGIGAKIEAGKANFKDLEAYMLQKGDATPNNSGRQEFLENLINEFV